MNKVTTINLNGKAYQLEEKGYHALHDYLEQASGSLADNPDQKEIVTDLEQAIADKCNQKLQDHKDVVTAEQIDAILTEMGPVQADENDNTQSSGTASKASRRLYLVQKGSMIMGVCNGLAVYLGIDATIVRIIFAVLTIVTGGFWILIYVLLGLILPVAKTDGQIAEAYGRRVTAQEIVEGAKDRAKDLEPTLSNVGVAIGKIVRAIFEAGEIVLAILAGLVTMAWLVALWWILFGNLHLTDQLATISTWMLAAGVTAVYCLVAVPLLSLSRACQRVADQKQQSQASRNIYRFGFGLWFVALAVLVIAVSSGFGRIRDYINTHHGYLDISNSHLCVDRPVCRPDHQDGGYKIIPTDIAQPPLPPVPTQN